MGLGKGIHTEDDCVIKVSWDLNKRLRQGLPVIQLM